MTDTSNKNEPESADAAHTPTASGSVPEHVYVYESAGISEHEGSIPIWLWVVVVTLFLWGFYYLVTYWSAPIGPK
jgi:hypothetical protein